MQADPADMPLKLTGWLQKKKPQAKNISISIGGSGGGISSETFILNLSWEEGGKARAEGMVLRTHPQLFQTFPEYDMGRQFHILECLQGTKVPVAKVYWLEEDKQVLGAPFYIMSKIDGVVPLSYPSYQSSGVYYDATPEQRATMWWGSLEAMAEVHKVDWKGLGLSFLGTPRGGTDPIDRQLDYWERYLDWIGYDPQEHQTILLDSLQWLMENRYVPKRVTLCWGDARLPNTIYSSTNFEVLGILDWEMAYLGDPESDLSWFLFMDWQQCEAFDIPPLKGTPNREEAIRRYEKFTGFKVENSFYNEVLAAFRYGAIMFRVTKCIRQLGVPIPEGQEINNVCTQRLAVLLGLPLPGPILKWKQDIQEMTVTVQFHLSGPGGGDWYVVVDKGKAALYNGRVDNPDITLAGSAADWRSIQSGEIGGERDWLMSSKFKIEGDASLLMQLQRENFIPEF